MIERWRWLRQTDPRQFEATIRSLPREAQQLLRDLWITQARDEQLPPPGDWRLWLICAGRGFGKTRTGAEWVNEVARSNRHARIALVGSSLTEVRAVMVEGESGLLACSSGDNRPRFDPSLRRVVWPGGAQAFLFSAAEPDSLRGPQHSHAWCDEVAKWDSASSRATSAWDNLLMGLRLGRLPQALATSTPRAVPLMQRLLDEAGSDPLVMLTRGATWDNAENLPDRYVEVMRAQFGQSALGRQELEGELLTESGRGVVLGDCSVRGASPEGWARAVAAAMDQWQADRVVAEANQGGDMVASVLRAADCQMPVRLVHASRGKAARAEPVAALYEAGRVIHAGFFPHLEDQLCGLMTGGEYQGPGRSPDRADALVWALSELLLGKRATPPRVHQI